MSFLGSLFDPAGAVATGGNNNSFDSVFNPGDNLFGDQGLGWEPSFITNMNNSYSEPLGNNIDNIMNVNEDELRNLGNHFKSNGGQLLYEGADPLSTSMWNKITNQHNDPFVNQYGGETNKDYNNTQARGINTEQGRYMGAIANMVAGNMAGGELGNLGSSAYGSMAGGGAEAGNDLGGFTGANAGGAADLEAGGSGVAGAVGGTSADAQDVYNLERGGSALGSVGAYQTASNATTGAGRGAANALNNNQNPWRGTLQGGLRSGLGSNLDYASGLGVENPLYKAGINGAINGGVHAGMQDTSNTGYGALVGALGGLAGQAGPAINSYLGQPTSGDGGSSGTTNWGNLATGLGNLYMARRNNAGIQSQINGLNSLYAPNSAYAQQMQQALQRQDAASGRGTQYGTRAVELQARLADMASRNAPTLSNLYAQQRQNRFNQYAGLLGTARNSGMLGNLGSMYSQQPNMNTSYSPIQAGSSDYSPFDAGQNVMSTVPPMIDPAQYGG